MEADELRKLVLQFVEQASPIVMVSTGTESGILDVQGTLSLWMQVPDCSYTAMFLGWALASGHDINSFSPKELTQAVQTALVGDNKNVMFDWLGDADASDKPH